MSFDIFRQGQRMAIKLIDKDFDGYSYYCYKAVDELRYIRCYGRRRQGCPATGKLVDGAPVLTIGHNHARNRLLHLQRIFQKELYKAVLIEPFQSFRLIYDHLCQRHSVAAVTLTWIKMEPVMLRWRKQVRSQHPSTPRNLMEYAAHLEIPQWQNLIRYGNGQLDVHTIAVADGSFITVISDINFLGLINPVTLLMDATFKIRPIKPKIYQVFSIIGIIDDTPLSICWILMTSKSSSAYTAGLTYFKDTLAPHIQPQTIITDFEASLRYSVNLTFPQAHNVGCYFHFCQALIKKLKQFDLFRLCKEWIPGQIIIRKFMALALLPHQDIVPAYNWLITNLPADIQQIFGMFIRYFRRYWLTTVKPIGFSVYNEKTRTNNFSEGNNRRNKLRFGIHPNIWSFTEKLRDLQAVTYLELQSLLRGQPVIRDPRCQTLIRDRDLHTAWLLYEQDVLDIPNFLACASFFLKSTYIQAQENQNNMDIRSDEEEDVLAIGNIILQPAAHYYRMVVFQEMEMIFE